MKNLTNRYLLIFFLCLMGSFYHSTGHGNPKDENITKPNVPEPLSIDDIHQRINFINTEIERLSAAPPPQLSDTPDFLPEDSDKRLGSLSVLKSAYEQLLSAHVEIENTQKHKNSTQAIYEDYRQKGMIKKPPYSLAFLDAKQAELAAAKKQQVNADLTIEMLRQETEDAEDQLKNLSKKLRPFKEILALGSETDKRHARAALTDGEINAEYYRTIIQAYTLEIKRHEMNQDLVAMQIEMYEEQTAFVRANIQYDDEDLQHQLSKIDQKKASIKNEIEKIRSEQKFVEQEWLKAQQAVKNALQTERRPAAEAYLKAREAWRNTYQVVLELKQEAQLLLGRQRLTWQRRYDLVKGSIPSAQLNIIREKVRKNVNNLNQTLQIQQNYLIILQKQLGIIEARIVEGGFPAEIREHLDVELKALRRQLDRRLEYQSVIISIDQTEKHLLTEIEKKIVSLTITERLTRLMAAIGELWNFEILVVDDRPVTLKKIAVALFILVIGIVLARFMLNFIRRRFLANSPFQETTVSTVHKFLSYSAYLLVVLLALRMVNIPLTAFAFVGGAVAIGAGFGAQNLINNFISGFMILGERPINIGDLIEVDGMLGKVEEIGARCTRVRTGENIHILVPNSSFLEKNITNWTLSDKKIRTRIVVGVAYGSPVRTVEKLLNQAARQTQRVLSNPETFVLFSDFGDNALIFNVYFWVNIQLVLERRIIESNVRFCIDELFNEHGIVIAFPQRDIHVDNNEPLKIQLTGPDQAPR